MHSTLYLSSLFVSFSAGAALWQPPVASKFQIILSGVPELSKCARTVTPNADVFDIDLFDTDTQTIKTLHKLNKKVICYFSAGTYEPGRPDSKLFSAADKGAVLPDWPKEKWIKVTSPKVRAIMADRIKLAKQKGCDAVDPDNMDGYGDKGGGLRLTQANAVDYMKFLASTAAEQGLSIGLKNAIEILPQVLPFTQFAVNEQCVRTKECEQYEPYLAAQKPVFHIEYPDESRSVKSVSASLRGTLCANDYSGARLGNFSTVIKNMDLGGWAAFCDGTQATTRLRNVVESKPNDDEGEVDAKQEEEDDAE